jgi:glycosyltransferase involved in cell wall biosynthesis
VILFLHNRYRTTGGEERVVEDLLWLVRGELGEAAELVARDSERVRRGRAAFGLVYGGLGAAEVARTVRRVGARVLHAHNVHPTLGWRALAAAREAGARVVLHLHQYRLVCAVGVCFTHGEDCTRCHGRNTLPGVLHNCRGSAPEALAYAVALSAWQRRLVAQADAFVVPSRFAAARLAELGAPVGGAHVVPPVLRRFAAQPAAVAGGHALLVSRLAPEKGVEVAIEACRIAEVPLVIAGDGPLRASLEARFGGSAVRFVGRVGEAELALLRQGAGVALAPSRSAETFGLAAAEAMAAGLPVAGSRIGALPELVPDEWLAAPGDAAGLAERILRLRGNAGAGAEALDRARRVCAPEVVAPALAAVYAGGR